MPINFFVFAFSVLIIVVVPGCASSGLNKIKEGALELVGVASKDAAQESRDQPLKVRLFAGRNLNADERGRGMAVVFHFYRLRDTAVFMQTPYDVLADAERAKSVLASDLVEMKELVLKPGQEINREESMGASAPFLGVVALYRKPFPERWRLVFEASNPGNAKGIVLGAHECALTVSQGVPLDAQLVNPGSLGGVRCR